MPEQASTAHKRRISVGSTLKYSPIPPHTPQIILSVSERYNLLVSLSSIFKSPLCFPCMCSFASMKFNFNRSCAAVQFHLFCCPVIYLSLLGQSGKALAVNGNTAYPALDLVVKVRLFPCQIEFDSADAAFRLHFLQILRLPHRNQPPAFLHRLRSHLPPLLPRRSLSCRPLTPRL